MASSLLTCQAVRDTSMALRMPSAVSNSPLLVPVVPDEKATDCVPAGRDSQVAASSRFHDCSERSGVFSHEPMWGDTETTARSAVARWCCPPTVCNPTECAPILSTARSVAIHARQLGPTIPTGCPGPTPADRSRRAIASTSASKAAKVRSRGSLCSTLIMRCVVLARSAGSSRDLHKSSVTSPPRVGGTVLGWRACCAVRPLRGA
ncbi:Uncharacterised protein [Mycobacteroides abscessus subsp. bolletii]|nr:Uncharacterised protein [Mycobacteroides abscessus subsp. bolletii]